MAAGTLAGLPPADLEVDEAAKFEEKVRRTVLIDDLSPILDESVIKSAISQFGVVQDITLCHQELKNKIRLSCALVELETREQAVTVVEEFKEKLFMLGGLPRPVTVRFATAEMFPERPSKKRCFEFYVVSRGKRTERTEGLARRHAEEIAALKEIHLNEQKKLALAQEKILEIEFEKYECIQKFLKDKRYGYLECDLDNS